MNDVSTVFKPRQRFLGKRKFNLPHFNYFGLVVLLLFLAISFNACRKNENVGSSSGHPENIKVKPSFEDVVKFTQRAIQEDRVSSRTPIYYSLADGKGLLEESLNLSYCIPDTGYLKYDYFADTVFIPVTTTNDLFGTYKWLSETTLEAAFDEISDRAGAYFESLVGSDIEPVQFGLKLSDYGVPFSGDTIEIHYYLISGIGLENSILTVEYGDEDYWWYDATSGKCPPESGGQGLGAASIFTRDLRRELYPRRSQYQDFYFKDPIHYCFHVHNSCFALDIPEFNFNEYVVDEDQQLLFFSPNGCLSPEQMNFHFNAMKDDLILASQPQNKAISGIFVGHDFVGNTKVHSMAVTYSTIVYRGYIPNIPKKLRGPQ